MANPQTENGMTRINHETMEKLLLYPFPSAQPLKICLLVIRKTWGFGKKADHISISQFQLALKSSRPTVVHWLDYLVKASLLVKGVQLVKKGMLYSFNKDWETWKGLVKPLELVKARTFTSKPPLTVTSKPPLTHKRNIKEITQERGAQFEEFWNSYPRKTNKLAALKSFQKIDVSLHDLIVARLDEQKKSGQWQDVKYIPHASTWLNNKRWEDEVASKPPVVGSPEYYKKYITNPTTT